MSYVTISKERGERNKGGRPGRTDIKKGFDGRRWRQLCSIHNCKTQATKNGICNRHFTEIRKENPLTEGIVPVDVKKKFIDMQWQQVCSVSNSIKYPRKKDQCKRNFNENAIQQKSIESNAFPHLSSTHFMIKESDTTSDNSNHLQNNTFDSYQNIPATTLQQHSPFPYDDEIANIDDKDYSIYSKFTFSPDISTNASNDAADKQNNEINMNRCKYRVSTTDDDQCQNMGVYKCSHCSFSYCLEHDLQHQGDLKEDINYVLDEAQELIDEIPSLNIDSGKKNCIEQFKHWMEIIFDQIEQKYQQFLMELDKLHSYVELNKDQWKTSLVNRMQTRVSSVLMKQVHKHDIDGLEISKARDELVRVQKLCDLLNSQTLITVAAAEDNHIDFNTPHLAFSSAALNGFNWMDEFSTQNNSTTMEYFDQQKTDVNKNTTYNETDYCDVEFKAPIDCIRTNQVKKVKKTGQSAETTTDNSLPMDFDTSKVVSNVINQSIDNTSQQIDLSSIESTIGTIQNVINLPANIETAKTNSTYSALLPSDYHNSKLEQMIMDQKDGAKLNLKYEHLTCQDMKIVAHHLLTNSKSPMTLDLSCNRIGDDGVYYLSIALQSNTILTTLDLSGNQIGNKGVQYLSDALRSNQTLTTLKLSRNLIEDEGAQYIRDALQSNETLKKLYLGWNTVSKKIIHELTLT